MIKEKFGRLKKSESFTLIELLVVISIIAILAAMLMPALGRARTAANRTVSVSNTRQIATSMFYYANDHNDWLPFSQSACWTGSRWDRCGSTVGFWTQTLVDEGYQADRSIYFTRNSPTGWTPDIAANMGALGRDESNYRNYTEDTGARSFAEGQPLRLGEGVAPPASKFLLLVEAWDGGSSPRGIHRARSPREYDHSLSYGLYNYDGGIPRAYVDGRGHAGGPVWDADQVVHLGGSGGHGFEADEVSDALHPDCLGWHHSPTNPAVVIENNPFRGEGPYGGMWLHIRYHARWEGAPFFGRFRRRNRWRIRGETFSSPEIQHGPGSRSFNPDRSPGCRWCR